MILIVKESQRIPITEKHVSIAGRSGAITIRTTSTATAPNMKHMSNRTGVELIVKNNLAIDLKQVPARVWMTGPGLEAIVKNNLAISQIVIFQAVGESRGHI
jgi:hypothetical protein